MTAWCSDDRCILGQTVIDEWTEEGGRHLQVWGPCGECNPSCLSDDEWAIAHGVEDTVECPGCHGTGTVGPLGAGWRCPACHGDGEVAA